MEMNRCMGCMTDFRGYPCPECGYDPAREQKGTFVLQPGVILCGKFLVGKVLGQGGFGITYLGLDMTLERKVAIKEYYPSGQVSRMPGTRALVWSESQQAVSARQEGMDLLVRSAFRTRETQQALYDNKIKRLIAQGWSAEEAPQEAAKWVARPGTSEHEAGLALDIVAADFTNLTAAQADTPQQQWLMANAHRFGFILRYPEEKQSITGIGYEPWHYRYVGPEAAEQIYSSKLCLEEYLDTLPSPAP